MFKVLILFSALFLAACDKPVPVFEKISEDATILAFGDSLTYGTGASKDADYPNILSELSSHEVINAGVPGEITRNGLKRLPALLDKLQPELLILIHGGNDLLRKVPQQQTLNNIEQMIDEAQQRNIKVVMLGVPKPSLLIYDSAEVFQKISEQQNIPIDLETMPDILNSSELKSDAVHPNDKGYQIMAENIFNLLVDAGAL